MNNIMNVIIVLLVAAFTTGCNEEFTAVDRASLTSDTDTEEGTSNSEDDNDGDKSGEEIPVGETKVFEYTGTAGTAKVDLSWIIDVSGSMNDEQTNIKNQADLFVDELVASSTPDMEFKIGVYTSCWEEAAYGYTPINNPNLLTHQALASDQQGFKDSLAGYLKPGTISGCGKEYLLKVLHGAIDDSNSSNPESTYNKDLFSADYDRWTYVILLTDEDDLSIGSSSVFEGADGVDVQTPTAQQAAAIKEATANKVAAIRGSLADRGRDPNKLKIYSIIHKEIPQGEDWTGRYEKVGHRYMNLYQVGTGLGNVSEFSFSIRGDYSSIAEEIATGIGVTVSYSIPLPSDVHPNQPISVMRNGEILSAPSDYQFSSSSNTVILTQAIAEGDEFAITYKSIR